MATRRSSSGLTTTQEKAILALLDEPTVAHAAKAAGVGRRTMYRWMDDPNFSKAFRKARRESFSQAMAASQKFAPVAVQVLAKIMADTSAPMSSRVSAATALLKFSRESIELDDLATRVDDLERSMKEASSTPPVPPPTSQQVNWGDRACA
ncbi:MAG: hypothetical protein KF902_06315 [Phycisphaeraceae bacterium]|nr:hypothetical protein [Phycisphaeraceae bacterium]QYK48983.1 MAG: hypothetical protein KF838_03820 [Phycisphaeraceae bacterium]